MSNQISPESYAILKFMDIENARLLYWKDQTSDETILANLHHTRLSLWYLFTRKERRESWVWLTGNGYALPDEWRIREKRISST